MTKIVLSCMNNTTADHSQLHRNDRHKNLKKIASKIQSKNALKSFFLDKRKYILKIPMNVCTTNIHIWNKYDVRKYKKNNNLNFKKISDKNRHAVAG